jgi:hypothetical protein
MGASGMFKKIYVVLLTLGTLALLSSPASALTSTPTGFGFHGFEASLSGTQAGSHPNLTVTFELNRERRNATIFPVGGQVRNLAVNLPPGLAGNPTAVPECTRQQFDDQETLGGGCPADTQIGVDKAALGGTGEDLFELTEAVYNIVPPPGVPAEFGFDIEHIEVFVDAGVRSGGDYGVTAHTNNIVQRDIVRNTITIFGEPGGKPFLMLPTSCTGHPLTLTADASTWEEPNATAEASTEVPAITDCGRLVHFSPSISVAPDTSHADTPTGLTVDVRSPQGQNPEGLATSGIEDTTVTLPAGLVINPGQAAGLAACQPAQDGLGSETDEGPPECPAASKVGTVEIETPLLKDTLKGEIYVLQSNPPDLHLLVAASADGVNLKLVGDVHLDETTGRLTTTFDGNPPSFEGTPDLPFTELRLSFSGGAQAALSTPTACGVYTTASDFTPWSSPFIPSVFSGSAFAIESGADASPSCPSSPLPFAPSLIAGATTDQAGGYTDFSMLLQRGDGQQRIERLQFKTPAGLVGMISGVSLCGEPQAAQGTCPAAAQIGHTVVEAGPGPYPLVVPQPGEPPAPIYLTGSYEGAPFGLSIVTPVIAGPFNLGTIVTRASIAVDPHTAQITVTTDPLPQIVDGVPTDLRTIDAVIDRPDFMFNPTDCKPMSFSGTASSTGGASAPLSSPFQVGSCRSLEFKPDFKVSTSGKTSRKDGASLDAKVIYPTGALSADQASSQSNIASVKVDLPKQLPSRLTTLQKACLAAMFEANPAACPAASRIGVVRASTPVLPVQLSGPVYFVSHGGEAFPSLVIVLQGDGVRVDLTAATFISKAGITSSTFKSIPDVPISSFELYLPEGKYSALAANGNLCKSKLAMPTAFTAQNGAVIHQSTPIAVTGCPKARAATRTKKKSKARKASHRHGKTGGK